jgi:aspartate racemase
MEKRKLGIVGGMGSHASTWLLKRVVDLQLVSKDQDFIEIILHNNSRIPDRTKAIVFQEESSLQELKRTISIFNKNNIDVAILACMTAHYYFEELNQTFNGKMISAVDLIADELINNKKYKGYKTVGLIGSTGLSKSKIFSQKLGPLGFEVVTLDDSENEEYFMKPLYMENGIKCGNYGEEVKRVFWQQIPILLNKGAEVIIGGCSEVPLMIDENVTAPVINVFDLLAKKVVDYCNYSQKD